MKINATYTEICEMLSKATGQTVTGFSVSKNTIHPLAAKLVDIFVGIDYLGCDKIKAIKRFREVTGRCPDPEYPGQDKAVINLADAKWAVENWGKFFDFVKKNGCLPKAGYYLSNNLTIH